MTRLTDTLQVFEGPYDTFLQISIRFLVLRNFPELRVSLPITFIVSSDEWLENRLVAIFGG